MHWRLTLDPDVDFAVEPGCTHSVQSSDFRGGDIPTDTAFQDPLTGLIMLTPSVLSSDFLGEFHPLHDWNVQHNFWRDVGRISSTQTQTSAAAGGGTPSLLGTVKPADMDPSLLAITPTIPTQIVTIDPVLENFDTLVWAAESAFTLGADEGFALHYHALTDEMLRKKNWFMLQWADIGIHFDSNGTVRTYYFGQDETGKFPAGYAYEEFSIGSPGEIFNKAGYFWFLPIPGFGLAVYHSLGAHFLHLKSSNARATAQRGHLIKLLDHDVSGVKTLFDPSTILIGLNPYQDYVLGFQTISYPATGVYTDSVFDPGYAPTTLPALAELAVPTHQTGCTATLRKADNSGAWTIGDQQGRVQLALSTTDSRYTPFAYAYQATWPPQFLSRAPGPVQVASDAASGARDRLLHLEWSDDEYSRFEGSADVLLASAAGMRLAERGDATFLLEKSLDGITWNTVNGGLAEVVIKEVLFAEGVTYYDASVTLKDMWARLAEAHQTKAAAFDGLTLEQAINLVLATCGFLPVETPSPLPAVSLPPVHAGQQFQFLPHVGQSGEEILESFLLFLRGQNTEWKIYYVWDEKKWRIVQKPRDMGGTAANDWTLTPFKDEETVTLTSLNERQKAVRYLGLEINPKPPEFNQMVVKGIVGSGVSDSVIVQSAPVINYDSLNNTASPDYLGRVVQGEFHALALSDQAEVDKMARRIFDAAAHRRLQPKVAVPYFVNLLTPLSYITLRGLLPSGARGEIFTEKFWVKRRTVIVEAGGQETMTLELDDQWTGELQI